MYGSQFHLEQTLNTKRFSTSQLEKNISITNTKNKKSWLMTGLILIGLSMSTMTFAGSSQPRLKGGNGNANGR